MTTPAPGAIDCDIHPALPSMQVLVALPGRVLARPCPDARPRARQLHGQRLPAERADQRPPRLEARRRATPAPTSTTLQTQALDAFAHTLRHLQRAARRARRSSARTCPPPSAAPSTTGSPKEWLDRRSAAARLHRRADAQPGARRRGDRTRAPPTNASSRCWCWEMQEIPLGRRQHWPIYRVGRATRPADRHPRRQLPTAIRRPISAGRPTTWKTTSPGPPGSPAC